MPCGAAPVVAGDYAAVVDAQQLCEGIGFDIDGCERKGGIVGSRPGKTYGSDQTKHDRDCELKFHFSFSFFSLLQSGFTLLKGPFFAGRPCHFRDHFELTFVHALWPAMHAHFRRTAGRKSLRSAKEFPNYFQTAVSLKKQRTSSNGHRARQWMGGTTMCSAAGLNCGDPTRGMQRIRTRPLS
jgi:hypothetical protein